MTVNNKSLCFTQHFLRLGKSVTVALESGKYLVIAPYTRGNKLHCQFAIADAPAAHIGQCSNVRDLQFARMIAAIDGLQAMNML